MAAYRRVYDSRHLQADCQEPGPISSGTLRSVIEYGLLFFKVLTNDERRFAFRTEKSIRWLTRSVLRTTEYARRLARMN